MAEASKPGQRAVVVTELRRPIRVVPCDHSPPCGWLHHEAAGPLETVERIEYEEGN